MCTLQSATRSWFPGLRVARFTAAVLVSVTLATTARQVAAQDIIRHISGPNQRLELTANTSRILTLERRFKRVVVNNPELVSVSVLSPNEAQVAAKQAGVTQLNLFDENDQIYSVDVVIYGDVQELDMAIRRHFPYSSVRVTRYANTLMLDGFVESTEDASVIQSLAVDYAPKVINNIKVAGVHKVLLNVKVMEVSRTKLRSFGFDFAEFNGNDFIASSVSGLIDSVSSGAQSVTGTGGATVNFGIVDNSNAFFGFLEALVQRDLAKVLAEPQLVAVNGRPASFNVGGEFPVLVPQSLGTVSIEYKKFGTQVDFVPIILGNGNIRLEVRPRVSEIDPSRSVEINDTTVPGLKVREVDTAVEMKAGQTLALAGLIQRRIEAQHRGLPVLSDIPIFGMPFRRVEEEVNEVELLIVVRPEYVDAMDPHEVPPGGPGLDTCSPSDIQLYRKGHIEVPCCGNCSDGSCPSCRSHQGLGPNTPRTEEVIPPATTSMRNYRGAGQMGVMVAEEPYSRATDQSPGNYGYQTPTRAAPVAPLPTGSSPYRPRYTAELPEPAGDDSGLIGPIGYDN